LISLRSINCLAAKATMVLDIIIVGGGLSGMSAAYEAHQAGKKIVVLEARSRVGGRTYTVDTESGGRSDLGGAWINEFTQPNITKLAQEAGIPIIQQSILGTAVIETSKNDIQTYEDRESRSLFIVFSYLTPTDGTFELSDNVPLEARLDEKRVVALLDHLCTLVDIEEPWKCERAEEFDSISFLGWLNSVGAVQATKDSMACFIRCLFALELNDVSFLYTLHYFVCGGKPSLGALSLRKESVSNGDRWLSKPRIK
jgi:monoamine oxidase